METTSRCSCCLRRPPDRDMKIPYITFGKTEIYSDMLKECFEIHLTKLPSECGICEVCVGRLRDARDFKRQVLQSQTELQGLLDRGEDVKEETPSLKSEISENDEQLIHLTQEVKLEMSDPLPSAETEFKEYEMMLVEPAVKLEAVDDVANDEAPLLTWHDAPPLSVATEQAETCSTLQNKMHNESPELKRYQCETCNKRFTMKCNLKVHLRIHTGQTKKPHSCELCQKQFTRKSHVARHMKSHREPLKCEVCNQEFTRKGHLDEHIRSHLGQKPYKCKICDRRFTMRGNLKVHMKNHTGQTEKPYSCHVCSKQFTRKSHLDRHENIHTGLKPYCCEICDKRFKEKGYLNDHIRFHIGQTFYNCEVCNKGFIHKTDLKRHVSVHTGEKPYSCEVCHKQFRERGNMNKHMRIHTKPKTEKNM